MLFRSADVLGHTTYVIDFHLEHLSGGFKGASFEAMEAAFCAKWEHALRPRLLQTTCSLVTLSGNNLARLIGRVALPSLSRITKRLPGAAGWSRKSA